MTLLLRALIWFPGDLFKSRQQLEAGNLLLRHQLNVALRWAYRGVPVGTIKRFIAGKGNADKQAVIAAVRSAGSLVSPGPQHTAVGSMG